MLILISIGFVSGCLLFRKPLLPKGHLSEVGNQNQKVSVIIPARNEEMNLPYLLESLQRQTLLPYEVIVVNDHSVDRTKEIAEKFSTKVIDITSIPSGWLGKTWAVWNGYLKSSGDILVFLDSDVRLEEDGLERLILALEQKGGAISVVPFHRTEKFYEKFAMLPNHLALFTFSSPFENHNPEKGLYGSCIAVTRKDYEKIGGHKRIRAEITDDLKLGTAFKQAGVPVTNFLGKGAISFRMYPNGIKSSLEGFAKSAALSMGSISKKTIFFIACWVIGLMLSELAILFLFSKSYFPLVIGYFLYVLQILYINKYSGNFGLIHSVFHSLSFGFFIVMMLYSTYQTSFRKAVVWKGRTIEVGRRD